MKIKSLRSLRSLLSPISAVGMYAFPRVCHVCGATLSSSEKYVCASCLARMPRTLFHRLKDNPVERRFMGLFPFERAASLFFYSRDSDLSVLMHDLKYRHFGGLAKYLGCVAANELLPTGFLSGIDAIVPVPMYFMKKARRGYNQTELVAAGISEVTGIPVCRMLHARRPHRTQTSLSLTARRKNTSGIFRADPQPPGIGHILLLDDVCTTGATLTSSAEALLAANPALKITIFTLGATF